MTIILSHLITFSLGLIFGFLVGYFIKKQSAETKIIYKSPKEVKEEQIIRVLEKRRGFAPTSPKKIIRKSYNIS